MSSCTIFSQKDQKKNPPVYSHCCHDSKRGNCTQSATDCDIFLLFVVVVVLYFPTAYTKKSLTFLEICKNTAENNIRMASQHRLSIRFPFPLRFFLASLSESIENYRHRDGSENPLKRSYSFQVNLIWRRNEFYIQQSLPCRRRFSSALHRLLYWIFTFRSSMSGITSYSNIPIYIHKYILNATMPPVRYVHIVAKLSFLQTNVM